MALLRNLLQLLCLGLAWTNPLVPQLDLATPSVDATNYRLPNNTIPVHYALTLEPYFNDFTFDGDVTITITATEDTNTITLHMRELTINAADILVTTADGLLKIDVKDTEYLKDLEFYVITLNTNLVKNSNYQVSIKYKGILNYDRAGFYRSSYLLKNETERWLATTQFEPTSARLAFPCYDEPAAKATFSIQIYHDNDYNAISNMPGKRNGPLPEHKNRILTVFEKTVKMSTYLVAFIVSDFKYIENYPVGQATKHRVFSQPDFVNTTVYALGVSEKILQEIEKFVDIKYELEKMDQAAIPDFNSGAMENWGLVTYREQYLLLGEGVTEDTIQRTAAIISHEFGHQWFGNLVSPKWWSYLWLNEGFATFFEYFGVSLVEPSWRMNDQFLVNVVQNVFIADSKKASRPMTFNVGSRSEISDLFDYISYSKSGSVIRMAQHFLGMTTFQKGLTKYLNKMSFSAADSNDLFESLQDALDSTQGLIPSSTTVKEIMDSWSLQTGYPLITVTRNYTNGVIEITQDRFVTFPGKELKERWWVPINYVTAADPNFVDTTAITWMRPSDSSITLTIKDDPDVWVIVNSQETGYYRVNYDVTNWNLIAETLKNAKTMNNIHVLNRAQIIDDSAILAGNGHLATNISLNILSYLDYELDYIPWVSANRHLRYLNHMLTGTSEYSRFQAWMLSLISGLYKEVNGFNESPDEHLQKFSRTIALTWACNMGLADCRNEAKKLVKILKKDAKAISPDLQGVAYCAALRNGDEKDWELLWNKYIESESSSERTIILTALGCSENKEVLTAYMTKAMATSSELREQDRITAISSVLTSGPQGAEAALNFLSINVKKNMKSSFKIKDIKNLLNDIGSRVKTPEQVASLKKFGEEILGMYGETVVTAVAAAVEAADANLRWLDENLDDINSWLVDNVEIP